MKHLSILSSSILILSGCSTTPPTADLTSAINKEIITHPSAAGVGQKPSRSAPELFYDFGVDQGAKKGLPIKAIEGRSRSVRVNSNLLWSNTLTLTLFDDVVVTVVRDRLIDKVKGSSTWIGHVEGYLDSEVFLTTRGQSMSGTVQIGSDLYEINQSANSLHEIIKVDPSRSPEHPPLNSAKQLEALLTDAGELSSTALLDQAVSANVIASTTIDLLVVYTPQARENAGGLEGIEAKIFNAVAKANQAYINSEIDMQLNLVHVAEIAHVETGNTSDTLYNLAVPGDGIMDAAPALRDQYGADQVVLISADAQYCGLGYVMTDPSVSFSAAAYSVVHDDSKYACLSNNTLAHELGHNQGDAHDRDSAGVAGSYDYSYGYRLCQTGGFRTVMSYDCTGGVRVSQFSNPNVLFNGEYTGTSTEDNARSMNNTKAIVASFRGSMDISTPNAPSGMLASTLSDTETSINWVDNSDNETGFRLEDSIDGVSWREFATVGSNVRSFTSAGLVAETNYQYRARAYNGNGNSDFSNVDSTTTDAAVVEACVTNDVLLTIVPSVLYSQAGATVSYDIGLTNQDSLICGPTAFTISGSDGTVLGTYSLGAGNVANTKWATTAPTIDGSYSKSVTVIATQHSDVTRSASIIVDGTAPTAPSNLTAVEIRKGTVGVSWGASVDNGSGFDRYVVMRNGVVISTTTSTSLTDRSGLGVFTYTVEAYDKVGNVGSSSASIAMVEVVRVKKK